MKDSKSKTISRRSFIKIGGFSVALVVASNPLTKAFARPDPSGPRRLLILEQNGGNDGINTVIPYSSEGYRIYEEIRRQMALPYDEVLSLENGWAFHPSLQRLATRFKSEEVAVIRNIGLKDPHRSNLSHFDMMEKWRAGNPQGFSQTSGKGWAGRIVDRLATDSPIAALSLSTGVGPMLLDTERAASATSSATGMLDIPEEIHDAFRDAMRRMAEDESGLPAALAAARRGLRGANNLSDFLLNVPDGTSEESETARLTQYAANIFNFNDWVRVIHIPLPLEHDTHIRHLPTQEYNLAELDKGIATFFDTLNPEAARDTLVVTMSEFGRRAEPNGESTEDPNQMGTDHGTANTLFFVGNRVKGGLYGEDPDLKNLDPDGNLRATDNFMRVEASIAAFMGIDPEEIGLGSETFDAFRPST
ncbi:MAG: DUF1501 domain-containing protein [Acidobacteriota bacterium]